MAKSKIPEAGRSQYNFEAYNQRDVMGLPPLSRWSPAEENTQKTYNRIFQPGFMHRNANDVLADAKMTKTEWLTDVCCPSASAEIMLHISKEMVTTYQISETELNSKAHELYNSLVTDQSYLDKIERLADEDFTKQLSGDGAGKITESASVILQKRFGIASKEIPPDQLNAEVRLLKDIERRKIINKIVSKSVNEHLSQHAEEHGLERKTLHNIGETHDFAFFGAAGSGKSTIAQQYVSDGPDTGPEPKKIDKRDCVILATDNYRAFTMPETDEHELKETKDVFTRTQDIAYMVKELVQHELRSQSATGKRPNLICDCVRLEWPMPELLGQSPHNLVSKVAAFRGNPGYVGIAERVDARARKEDADPADKGRFVETTSLLSGHAIASKFLLSNIPPNAQTEILDTDVDRDANESPRRIAMVDSRTNLIEIDNLRVMSEFLNKQNINAAAQHPVELIIKAVDPKTAEEDAAQLKGNGEVKFSVTTPENKAKAVLALVGQYSVILKDNQGIAYAKLLPAEGAKVRLEVLDAKAFAAQLKPDEPHSPEAEVLSQITRLTMDATRAAANGKDEVSPEMDALAKASAMLGVVDTVERTKKSALTAAEKAASDSAEVAKRERDKKEGERDPETEAATEAANTAARRVLSAAIASPKIITGNYSAIMNCLNDVLTNTVTILPDPAHVKTSPIFFIAEPMWLDAVHPSYDQEPWGQGIDAFPPAVQKFAEQHLKPVPTRGEKLTWGQVRELRAKMLAHLETSPGFIVIKGEIANVEQVNSPSNSKVHELNIQFTDREAVSIPFTGKPVVLDFSQRPRPAGDALKGDPTVLYRQSSKQNAATSGVPIFCAGAGAQAAWVLDKMDNNRTYTVIYRATLDFRIANAILGVEPPRYTSRDACVKVNESPLKERLAAIRNGKVQDDVTYTKDDGKQIKVKIALYASDEKLGGDKKRLFKATDLPADAYEARAYLKALGVTSEERCDTLIASILGQMELLVGQGVTKDKLAIQLNNDMVPPEVTVGFAVNTTGFVALNDIKPHFWGADAEVTTGDTLTRDIKLVTASSLLPGSGIPRMLAMKSKLQEMRGGGVTYDVRALAFTEAGFQEMCDKCKFPADFSGALKDAIKSLETPENAGDPVVWIVGKYTQWLAEHPDYSPAADEATTAEGAPTPTREQLIEVASQVLLDNVESNSQAETRLDM